MDFKDELSIFYNLMVGIIGSGFGLYGYLPAVLQTMPNINLKLHSRAKQKFFERKELQYFEDRIVWEDDNDNFFDSIDFLIISLPPIAQFNVIVERIAKCRNLKTVLLEKPVANNPAASQHLLNLLNVHQINFRINYSFLYTSWFQTLKSFIFSNPYDSISITWSFKAHHYVNNLFGWKRNHIEGGGVIRFYGIHLLAVAIFLCFDNIVISNITAFSCGDYFKWHLVLQNSCNCNFIINIDSNASNTAFSILVENKGNTTYLYDQNSPFEKTNTFDDISLDVRVGLLSKVIKDVNEQFLSTELLNSYNLINNIWQKSELFSKVEFVKSLS